jgi:hypothetical protein
MISPEAAIEHFSRILRAANSEPSAQISGVQSRVLGAAAARGRTLDGSIMGWLMQEFSQSIKQTVEKSVAEAKRVFSIAGMPADEGTKAKVQELVWSTASTLIRAIDESLTPVLACNPTVPRPRPISELLEPVRLACLSELELFFTAARVSVSNQRLLQAGQVLDANLMLLAIFANALSSIDIIDPYIGCRLFAILSAKQSQTQVKIIYADGNLKPADAQCMADFQRQYGGLGWSFGQTPRQIAWKKRRQIIWKLTG